MARSTFWSKHAKSTPLPDHFWTLNCRIVWQGSGILHLAKSEEDVRVLSHLQKRWHAWDVGRGSATMHFRVAGAVQETSPSDDARTSELWFPEGVLFPRASERRVLPIVGVCISSSHLHTFSSSHLLSHLLIFTSSHLHICSSSHLLIFTSSHLHTFSSSHLLIFTSSHLHICSSSHLLIFTSSYLHIFSSSHLLIFTYSHLHILTSSRSLSLSRTHTLTYSHLLSLSSFLSPFCLSFLSPFSLSRLLYLSLFRPRVVPAGSHETWTLSHEMRVDRQKLRKNCDFTCPGATLSHEMRFDRQKLRKIASLCTFPLWNGLTHVPFQGHFSNKRRHVVRTFFWSTMPFCKKRVFCWANHFVRANFLYKMNSGPIIS